MKRNALTLVVGVILLLIFVLLLFTFQVRQTEVVVLTTFDKPSSAPIEKPGLYFKWPVPIQRVYRFDKRIHNFEDEYEQMLTRDGNNLLASVFVGWTITRPLEFFNNFPLGRPEAAEPALKSLVRSTKQAVIGQHQFSDFVSSDPKQVKFEEVEKQIFDSIAQSAESKYGVKIELVGIKRLGIPESVTAKVFERMTAERQREIDRIKSEGDREATQIKSAADRDRSGILAKATAEAITIRGEAEAQATKYFNVQNENADLAVYLMKLKGLEHSLTNAASLVVTPDTVPFDLLKTRPAPMPNNGTPTQAPNGPKLSENAETNK
jgi:membrane protease subunit HflC